MKYIGIDLGGSHIACGVVDEDGNTRQGGNLPGWPPFENIV